MWVRKGTMGLSIPRKERDNMPDYPKAWKWDQDGDDLEGVLTGLRYAKSKFDDGHVPVITLASNGNKVSIFLPNGLMRQISDNAPKYGDIIRIHRGDLVPFGDQGRSYRAWDVEVVRKEGTHADFSGPGLPEQREDNDDIPF
jgi:hypothetical protein